MRNHHTQFLENTFSKEILDTGFKLFEKGAVKTVISTHDAPVTAIVKDGKSYEVEVGFPCNPKQKAHCSCTSFAQLGSCKHITAVLYDWMAHVDPNQSRPVKTSRSTPKSSLPSGALHAAQILDVLTLNELKAFVKQYARTDRKFDIQFKAAFASRIDWEDNADKYRRILNNIVSPNTGSKPKLISQAELKNICAVLDTFAGQINDAIALEQYRSALNQFEPSFSKILYIYAQNPQCQKELMPLLKMYHDIAYAFLKVTLPPELRSECMNLLIDFGSRSYYHHNNLDINLWYGMMPFLRKTEKQKVENRIIEWIGQRSTQQKVILATVLVCYHGKFTKAAFQIFQKNHISYVELADKFTEIQQIHLLASMLDFLKNEGMLHKELQHRQLFVYAALQDFVNLGMEVKQLYSNTGDIKYLAIIKEAFPPELYTKWYTELEFNLLKANADPSKVITFYKFEKNWSGLLIYLERLNDPNLLMEHDAILLREEKDALTDLWMSMLDYQVTLLRKSDTDAIKIVQAFEKYALHFRSHKMDSIRKKVHAMLTKNVPDQNNIIAFFA